MWTVIANIAIGLIASVLFRPKVQTPAPAGLSEIKAPTAEDGREIPVMFGCRQVRGPNVVWYGDLRTVAIKTKGGKK